MEFSGLEPKDNVIIEIAVIVTDGDLNLIAEGPVIAINHPESVFDAMDEWNTNTHNSSGLVERCLDSKETIESAQDKILDFLKENLIPNTSPLCGNSIHQDRRFLRRYMPKIDEFHTYRIIDVTSFKEAISRWYPDMPEFEKKGSHKALDDIRESIAELAHYREHVFIKR